MRMGRYLASSSAVLVTLSVGCTYAPPTQVPMTTWLYAEPGGNGKDLIVLLPGINEQPTKYERRGFIDDLRSRGLDVDVVAVDAHFGYYKERNVVDRLKTDVVDPAKAKGYGKIWFVGFSVGGLGSLLYAMRHPDDVDGIVTLAPYLGEPALIREIKDAGGPLHWRDTSSEDDGIRRLWVWLKNYATDSENLPALYLGYGEQDRFAVADSLLASLLPPERVYAIAGGHNWRTWKKLWGQMLDSGLFLPMRRTARGLHNGSKPEVTPR
jgi:pimeloyl-ACP methyl ester carboxylesterase